MSNVTDVYRHIIDDVVKNVKADFAAEGVDDSVLHELQALWEYKLGQTGALRPAAAPPARVVSYTGNRVPDMNVPYMDPRAGYLPQYAQAVAPAMVPRQDSYAYQYPAPSSVPASVPAALDRLRAPKPEPYMEPPASWQQSGGLDVNVAYDETQHREGNNNNPMTLVTRDLLGAAKRKRDDDVYPSGVRIPQQDGAFDQADDDDSGTTGSTGATSSLGASLRRLPIVEGNNNNRWLDQLLLLLGKGTTTAAAEKPFHAPSSSLPSSRPPILPQWDGGADEYHDAVDEEDYNEGADEEPVVAPSPADASADEEAAVKDEEEQQQEETEQQQLAVFPPDDGPPENAANNLGALPLGQDDDNEGEAEPETSNLVLAQFDKVTRTKNKWKCTLKDGIMHLNGRDTLFAKANGEFEW